MAEKKTWHVKVDLSDAFAPIRYREISRTLHKMLGADAAWAMMKTIMGHSLSPSKTADEARRMCRTLVQTCDRWGLTLRKDKLCLWSNFSGHGIRIGAKTTLRRPV